MLDKTARFMFALIMIGFGINYFYPVIHPKLESAGTFFLLALDRTNYMMPMIKLIEMLVAILFLLNRFVHVGLILIAPVLVNVFMFHLMLERSGLLLIIFLWILWGIIAYFRRDQFRFLLNK